MAALTGALLYNTLQVSWSAHRILSVRISRDSELFMFFYGRLKIEVRDTSLMFLLRVIWQPDDQLTVATLERSLYFLNIGTFTKYTLIRVTGIFFVR